MYKVEAVNGNTTVVLHENDPDSMRRIASCTFTEGVNNVGSCDFAIYKQHPEFGNLDEMTTIIKITNTKTNDVEFEGRIAQITDCGMDNSGIVAKKCHCEGIMAYLYDTVQLYQNYENQTPTQFLNALVTNHNAQVTSDKQISSVVCSVVGNTNSKTTAYRTTLDEIKENLLSRLGGEIALRRNSNNQLVLYYFNDGEDGVARSTKVELARNMVSLKQDVDATNIITRLIPLGAQLDDETAERLTLSTDTYPTPWIDDTTAIAKYGVIVGKVEFDDIVTESTLLTKGQEALAENNTVKYSYRAEVLDLSTIGDDAYSFRSGNTYEFVNSMMSFDESLRIQTRTVDIYQPYKPRITIGEKEKLITSAISKAKKFVENDLPLFKSDMLSAAKANSLNLLLDKTTTGNVVFEYNQNGGLEAINFCDADTIESSLRRWVYNINGWGFMKRNSTADAWGSLQVAATMNGEMYANLITAGVLRGPVIQAGDKGDQNHTPILEIDAQGRLKIDSASQNYDGIKLTYNGNDSETGTYYEGYTIAQPWRFEVGEATTGNRLIISFPAIYGYYGTSANDKSFTLSSETGTFSVYGNNSETDGTADNWTKIDHKSVRGYAGSDLSYVRYILDNETGNIISYGRVQAVDLVYQANDGNYYNLKTLHDAVFNS